MIPGLAPTPTASSSPTDPMGQLAAILQRIKALSPNAGGAGPGTVPPSNSGGIQTQQQQAQLGAPKPAQPGLSSGGGGGSAPPSSGGGVSMMSATPKQMQGPGVFPASNIAPSSAVGLVIDGIHSAIMHGKQQKFDQQSQQAELVVTGQALERRMQSGEAITPQEQAIFKKYSQLKPEKVTSILEGSVMPDQKNGYYAGASKATQAELSRATAVEAQKKQQAEINLKNQQANEAASKGKYYGTGGPASKDTRIMVDPETGKPTVFKMNPETGQYSMKQGIATTAGGGSPIKQIQQQILDAHTAGDSKGVEEGQALLGKMYKQSANDQFIRVLGKPANEWTEQDKKIVKGEMAFNSITRIQPAVARANAYNDAKRTTVFDDEGNAHPMRQDEAERIGAATTASVSFQNLKESEKYFVSGPGAQQKIAANTAYKHLDQLRKITTALNNGDNTLANRLGNSYKQAFGGQVAPVDFEGVKVAMIDELGKSLSGKSITQPGFDKLEKAINRANSGTALMDVYNQFQQLMKSKVEILDEQREQNRQDFKKYGEAGEEPVQTTRSAPKKMTEDEGAAILKQAGGDVTKARKIAKAKHLEF